MRALLFFLFPLLMLPPSYAVEMSCSEVFSIHNRKPPANRHGFQPTEVQIVQILREVQSLMSINVRNLRAKVNDPRVEDIIERITGHRKPLRSVYNFAMTLHSYEWWVNRLGQTMGQVYKSRPAMTEAEIDKAIVYLNEKGFSLRIDDLRGSTDARYTAAITAALGREETANRLYLSSRAYKKTWKQRVRELATASIPVTIRRSNVSANAYQIKEQDIVPVIIQMRLANLGSSKSDMNSLEGRSQRASIIYEVAGIAVPPSALFTQVAVRFETPWRMYEIQAQQRMKETPLFLLVALFQKPPVAWELAYRPTDRELEIMKAAVEDFKWTLSPQERKVFDHIENFYATHSEWNPQRLSDYLRVRLGTVSPQTIESIVEQVHANSELARVASQL